jgi:hypothetical protein
MIKYYTISLLMTHYLRAFKRSLLIMARACIKKIPYAGQNNRMDQTRYRRCLHIPLISQNASF